MIFTGRHSSKGKQIDIRNIINLNFSLCACLHMYCVYYNLLLVCALLHVLFWKYKETINNERSCDCYRGSVGTAKERQRRRRQHSTVHSSWGDFFNSNLFFFWTFFSFFLFFSFKKRRTVKRQNTFDNKKKNSIFLDIHCSFFFYIRKASIFLKLFC